MIATARSEWLEPRLLMAAHTWIGVAPAGLNQLWSYGPNWSGGVAPGAAEAHVTLVFPPAGVQKVLTDDILNLAQVDSITFTGSGYSIGGNNTTIHLNALGATYNIDDQVGGNVLGDSGLTIAMVPSEYVRVQAGRLNINAKLTNDGASVGSLDKWGAGILQFGGSTSNSYTGQTKVDDGTLELNKSASACFSGDLVIGNGGGANTDYVHGLTNSGFLGASNITINDSGWLDMGTTLAACQNLTMNGGLLSSGTGQLTLNGTLTATSTALGAASISGKFRMSPGTHVFQIDDGPTFVDLEISAVLGETGPGAGFTKFGNGHLTIDGNTSNTYTGTTTIYTGSVDLGKTNGGAIGGALIIGDGFGGASSDVVRNLGYGELSPFTDVTVNASGVYDFNNQGDAFTSLTMFDGNVTGGSFQVGAVHMTGGTITTGTGQMIMYGDLTAVSDATQIPTINGMLNLDFGNRTFTTFSGPQTYDLVMNASIVGSGSVFKNGDGHLLLSGINSFNGGMVVDAGLLLISNNNALSDTGSGTFLTNGGALQLLSGVHIGGETLTINGSGGPFAGALNSYVNSIWDGAIVLGADTVINVGVGTLTLNGPISGAGGFIKTGGGTLKLFGSSGNTYAGTTYVNEGTLETNKSSGAAIPHDLIIGDDVGGPGADLVHTLGTRNLGALSTVSVGRSGRLVMDRTEDIGTLNIDENATAVLASTGGGTSVLALRTSASFAPGARLDVTNNSMIWDYTGGDTPAPFARDLLTTGYAGGAWNGQGINSSTAAATPKRAVGYAESSEISSSFPWTFQGFSVDKTAILFRYTLYGDSNLDGAVNLTDFAFLAANFNSTGKSWVAGDYNYDNNVGLTDFTFLAGNFNQSLPAAAAAAAPPAAQPLATSPLSQPTPLSHDLLWSEQLVSPDAVLG